MTDTRPLRGYLIGLICTAIWSTSGVFISYLTTRFGMPPLVLAFWRDFFVTCALGGTLALFVPQLLRLERQHLPFFFLYGFLLAVLNSLWTISVALNGAAVATLLIHTSPAFAALVEWRWGGERLNGLKIVAVALSIVGCVFASSAHNLSPWQVNPKGIIVGLATGLSFALYGSLGKGSSRKGIEPWTATLYTFAFGSALLLLVQRPETIFWLSRPLSHGADSWREALMGWGTVLILAIGPTIGGYGLYTITLTYLPVTTANLIVTLEPVMTTALAFFFLGERLSLSQLLGGVVILAGVFLLRLSDRRTPAAEVSAG